MLATTYDNIGAQFSNDRRLALHPFSDIAVDVLLVLELLLVVLRPLLGRVVMIRNHRVSISQMFLQKLVDIVLAYERRIGIRSHETATVAVEIDRLNRLRRVPPALRRCRRCDSGLGVEKCRRRVVGLVHGTLEVKRVGGMRVTRSSCRVWHVVSGREHKGGAGVTL